MKNKEYVVFGLGRFGSSVAVQLERNGCKVLAVDSDEERVSDLSGEVTAAICADIADEGALDELGIKNFDGAIIAIGNDLEPAVLATIWAKEHGVQTVIAKAYTPLQGRILKKVGADRVVYPEREMGVHLANSLMMNSMFDTIELSNEYSIMDVPIPKNWVGKSLKELKLREKFQVNVLAVRRGGNTQVSPNVDEAFVGGDVCVILGKNTTLKRMLGLK
jgi:trk system potassium uptake protein TrkA